MNGACNVPAIISFALTCAHPANTLRGVLHASQILGDAETNAA
jgi:hypothetical protein